MADAKLVEYIKASRLSGRADSEIRKTLTDIGWSEIPVDEALREADSQTHLSSSETPAPTSQVDTSSPQPESVSSRGRLVLLLVTVGLLLLFAIVGGFIALRGINPPGSFTQSASDRDKDRESDIKNYAVALGKYFDAHGRYPATSANGIDSSNASILGIFDSSGALKDDQTSFPKDPKNGESLCQVNASAKDTACAYKYRVSADGKKYILWAILENTYNNEGVYTIDSTGHHALVSTEPANP